MTYSEIRRIYKCYYGVTIKDCWIADVKRQLGFRVRNAYNRQTATILNRCPLQIVGQIAQVINGQITCP